jgi:hypothetical protein
MLFVSPKNCCVIDGPYYIIFCYTTRWPLSKFTSLNTDFCHSAPQQIQPQHYQKSQRLKRDSFLILPLCLILNKVIDTALLITIVICLKTALTSSLYWLPCFLRANFSRYFPTTVLYKPFLKTFSNNSSI